MTPLCFVDTETTGVHPDRRPWEIAIIRRDDAGQREWVTQISDVDLSNADPFGLQVGGYYERSGKFQQRADQDRLGEMPERAAAFAVWRMTQGAHLVGVVPDFDARTLDPMLRRHGLVPAWHYHVVDVEAMAVGYLSCSGPGVQVLVPWKSDTLSRACGVEPPADDGRHTAMGDAHWAMRWYDAMTGPVVTDPEPTAGTIEEARAMVDGDDDG